MKGELRRRQKGVERWVGQTWQSRLTYLCTLFDHLRLSSFDLINNKKLSPTDQSSNSSTLSVSLRRYPQTIQASRSLPCPNQTKHLLSQPSSTTNMSSSSSSGVVPSASALTSLSSASTNNDADEEVISPVAGLLLMSQAASGQSIQLPADLFSSFLQSFQKLEKEVASLKSEAVVSRGQILELRRNTFTLQHNAGGKFVNFPRLPIEVREKIWGYSVNHERVVGIEIQIPDDCGCDHTCEDRFLIVTHNPAELQTCSESRRVALKYLHPLDFDERDCLSPRPLSYYNPNGMFWWYGLDFNFIHKRLNEHLNVSEDIQIHTVACDWNEWYWGEVDEDMLVELSNYFEMTLREFGTEELILVIGDKSLISRIDMILVDPTMPIEEGEVLDYRVTWDTLPHTASLWDHFKTLHADLDPSCTRAIYDHTWEELCTLLAAYVTEQLSTVMKKYHKLREEAIRGKN